MILLEILRAVLLLTAATATALTPAQWRAQSVYQVMTDRFAKTTDNTTACGNLNYYCGGTWRGLINHLDYIQGMGFTAIWISPVVENLPASVETVDGSSYHGYWAQDIYSVNPSFGTAADLKALSTALHARGMYLMVDVVTNHMAYNGCGTCVDYSIYNPFNSQSYYHPYCSIDYNNRTSIPVCWEGDNIVSLPDLRTEDSTVLSMWETWITQLVANYSIDGLRVDSMQQVDSVFWQPWLAAAGDLYAVGEVFNGDPTYTCPYQAYLPGVMNYPAYYYITQAFESTTGSISNLANGINAVKSDCSDSTLLGSFLENHDNPRFPSYTSDISLAKNAIGFTMLQDGIPIIYQGQEQHYNGSGTPDNREDIWRSKYSTSSTLYTFIARVNAIRTFALNKDSSYLTYKAYPVYSDSKTIAMRKGSTAQVISVWTNSGASGTSYSITLTSSETGFSAGQSVTELLTCTTSTTDSNGRLTVTISGGLPKIFYPSSALSGSAPCSTSSIATTSASTIPTTLVTTSTPKSSASTTTSTCSQTTTVSSSSTSTSTAVAVTFNERVSTAYGDTIKIAGSISQLGDWATENAIPLSASGYTSSHPWWSVTLYLPPGTVVEYKYINVHSNGDVTWEGDPNHTLTVPASATTVNNSWQE
ncbi:Alpha-amylase domain [Teratosphaeria destructans]|uniref:alpha-amylase n=1 Tax=Teratosphaeria destructans TaxID=418781 RepID=A0A9W7ST87_9PEZI|nr:Alpha-amylase domain [Teratosphaeria destructans]